MNLILLGDSDFIGPDKTRAFLCDRRARHVIDIHRAQVGQKLRVGLVNGLMGSGRVARIGPRDIELDDIALDETPPAPLPLALILALPRPKVLSRVIESVAALGVKEIVLVNSARVEKSYFDSPRLSAEEVRSALFRGLEQGRDTVLPRVEIRERFRPFVEDEAPGRFADAIRLVAHPGTRDRLGEILSREMNANNCANNSTDIFKNNSNHSDNSPQNNSNNVPANHSNNKFNHSANHDAADISAPRRGVIALGPEGGFVPFEVELLQAQGFRPFHLGERILRVETAVSFVVGQFVAHGSPV